MTLKTIRRKIAQRVKAAHHSYQNYGVYAVTPKRALQVFVFSNGRKEFSLSGLGTMTATPATITTAARYVFQNQ